MSRGLSAIVEQGPFKFDKTKEDYDLIRLELVFGEDRTSDEWIKDMIQEIVEGAVFETRNDIESRDEKFFYFFHHSLMEWANKKESPLIELKWSSVKIVDMIGHGRRLSIIYKSVFDPWEYKIVSVQVI